MGRDNPSLVPPNASPPGVVDPAWLRTIELGSLCCLPMALKAAIQLNIFEILASAPAAAHGCQLSPDDIVAHIPTSNRRAAVSLDRILRVLASHSILSSSLVNAVEGKSFRRYGLTPVCKYLVKQDGASLAPIVLLNQDKVFMDTWDHLAEAVLDGGEPFTKAHGKAAFLYGKEDLRFDALFNSAMANDTKLLIQALLDTYNGFDGLTSLVDVGGGLGACLDMIVSRHPHIRGINFDQPHVIAAAPTYSGVQHVGGDMFESVPSGEAIFMKWILHDWSDEHCLKLLRNCHKALPENGKVIILDAIMPAAVDTGLRARVAYQMDLLMFAYNEGGKERTEEEFKELAKAAGFDRMEVVCMVNESTVMEFCKAQSID